ncbi:MAG TPA: PIN domain-containing protein [Candidatus Saccharimonadales bacterium]|nr:PIN domain-containing protein [Candidatus Saccharimonadales bacterium]
MLIALDSDVLIAALSPHEEHSNHAQQLIRDVASGKYIAVSSSLIYGEVLSVGTGKEPVDLENFIEQVRNLSTTACDNYVCMRAGELRFKYGGSLRLPDAIHLITAIKNKADLFITNDGSLAKVARELIRTKLLSEWV